MKNRLVLIVSGLTVLVTIVSAVLLYTTKNKNISPIAPESSFASTTTTISDDFNGANINFNKWDLLYPPSSTNVLVQAGGNLTVISINAPNKSGLVSKNSFVGDFTGSVKMSALLPGTGNNGVASFGYFPNHVISWTKTQTESYVEMFDRFTTPTTSLGRVSLGNITSINVKLVRTGGIVQGFVNLGNGYVLIGSVDKGITMANGKFQIYVEEKSGIAGAQSQATFDDFVALVNQFEPLPTPLPALQCTL